MIRTTACCFAALLLAPAVTAALAPVSSNPVRRPLRQNQPVAIPLPNPSGDFSVGTTVFLLKDATRKNATDAPREFLVQVWYPAAPAKAAKLVPYLPETALLEVMKKEAYNDLSPDVLDQWRSVQTHSFLDAPIVSAPSHLPLLFFAPGLGMSRSNYTSLMEDLASHGFMVVAIDHPFTGLSVLPGGKVLSLPPPLPGNDPEVVNSLRVHEMARDASFTLDCLMNFKQKSGRFAGHIAVTRVGIFGHSLGGAAAIAACQQDARFRACADMDGDLWGKMPEEGVARPLLVLLNEPPEDRRPPLAMREQRDKGWADFISRKKSVAFVVKVSGTNHFSFSDFPFVVPATLMAKSGAEIAPQRGYGIITRLLREFFSQHLGNSTGTSVEAVAKSYPEVTVRLFPP